MRNLCDEIAEYLLRVLERAGGGPVVVSRQSLAAKFGCAPSQINYVLETRFSATRGYLVESRRGGGGFIRITALDLESLGELIDIIEENADEGMDQATAEDLIARLFRDGMVGGREVVLMRAAVQRETLALDLPLRDLVRARVIKAMILALMGYRDREGGPGDAMPGMPEETGDR